MRVIHITVKTEETQILRIKFVLVLSYLNSNTTCTVLPEFKHNICLQFALYCPTCAYQHKQVYLSNCQSGQRSRQQILVDRSMILTTIKSTILNCQQVNSSNSRSTFPPLNASSKEEEETRRHIFVHGFCWTIASVLNFQSPSTIPILHHAKDEATPDIAAPIHGSGIRQINIVRGNSPCMIQSPP